MYIIVSELFRYSTDWFHKPLELFDLLFEIQQIEISSSLLRKYLHPMK